MDWISRFLLINWPHIFDTLLLTMALLCGIQVGESRVQKEWDSEKTKIAQVQAKQEQRVADVRQSQSQITQDISHEFSKRSKLLADHQPDNRVGRLCGIPATCGGGMPTFSEASARAAPARSDLLPAPKGDEGDVSCEQLSKDAAQTTLMLLEVQRWYQKQSTVDP
jgi:hypothetical protein